MYVHGESCINNLMQDWCMQCVHKHLALSGTTVVVGTISTTGGLVAGSPHSAARVRSAANGATATACTARAATGCQEA
jgi:hypothetical protein